VQLCVVAGERDQVLGASFAESAVLLEGVRQGRLFGILPVREIGVQDVGEFGGIFDGLAGTLQNRRQSPAGYITGRKGSFLDLPDQRMRSLNAQLQ